MKASNHLLPSSTIKDAIATKFSWQILHQFFLKTVYPSVSDKKNLSMEELANPEVHDKIGWEIYLQELWDKPDWDQQMFYNPSAGKKEKATAIKVDDVIKIEVSEELPLVKMKAPELKIIYTIGGIEAGTATCKKNWLGRVTPQMIRAAITSKGAYEVCRVVVREALIGQKIEDNTSLTDRLKKKSGKRS